MNRRILEQVKGLEPGDLVRIDWWDASVGRSLSSGTEVDISVKSWGIYIALLGVKRKHIILAQNTFRYTEELYDVDYTSIPLSWGTNIEILARSTVPSETANRLLKSFLAGRCRTIKKRTRNHELGQEGFDAEGSRKR